MKKSLRIRRMDTRNTNKKMTHVGEKKEIECIRINKSRPIVNRIDLDRIIQK